MIRDKDFVNMDDIPGIEQKYQNKVKFLKRRCIENYILDSNELFEVYTKHGNKKIKTYDEMMSTIKLIVDSHFEQTVDDYYEEKKSKNKNYDHVTVAKNENAEIKIKENKKLKRIIRKKKLFQNLKKKI